MLKTKNIAPLPVAPYLHKWLCNYRGYRDRVEVSDDMLVSRSINRVFAHNWMQNERGYPSIRVSMYYPSRLKLYILHQLLEHSFNIDMMAHIRAHTLIGINARTAMRKFLHKCSISEEELALDTAYKRWQRLGKNSLPGMRII